MAACVICVMIGFDWWRFLFFDRGVWGSFCLTFVCRWWISAKIEPFMFYVWFLFGIFFCLKRIEGENKVGVMFSFVGADCLFSEQIGTLMRNQLNRWWRYLFFFATFDSSFQKPVKKVSLFYSYIPRFLSFLNSFSPEFDHSLIFCRLL